MYATNSVTPAPSASTRPRAGHRGLERSANCIIGNVASECGFTPQYKELEALHRKYEAKGFAVLGFPCNDFGAQEPGTAD